MQILFKLLRSRGVLLPTASVQNLPWTIASLETGRGHSKHLTLRALLFRPDHTPLAELYGATVKSVDEAHMVLRGVERTEVDGRVAAVVQEWCLKLPPVLGSQGMRSPEAHGITGWDGHPGNR